MSEIKELKDLLQKIVGPSSDGVVGVEEAARILGRTKSAVYHLIARRKLDHYKDGKLIRFDPVYLREYVKRNPVKAREF